MSTIFPRTPTPFIAVVAGTPTTPTPPQKTDFSYLPSDLVKVILLRYCHHHTILTRHVCRTWYQSTKQQHHQRPNTRNTYYHIPSSTINSIIQAVAEHGNFHLIQWLHDYLFPALNWHIDWNLGLISAARSGHIDVVRLCKEKYGASDVNRAMAEAASGGHEQIVRLCKEQYGATDIFAAMMRAAWGGYIDIVRLCIDKYGCSKVDPVMTHAANAGHMNIVRLCKETYSATDIQQAMCQAAFRGHMDIVRLCKEDYGATDVDDAMRWAAMGNHIDIVRLCKETYGATDVYKTLVYSARYGRIDIIRLCLEQYGPFNAECISDVINAASYTPIVWLLQRYAQSIGV